MVESDDYVGGAAIQHREVEGNESEVSYMYRGLQVIFSGRTLLDMTPSPFLIVK